MQLLSLRVIRRAESDQPQPEGVLFHRRPAGLTCSEGSRLREVRPPNAKGRSAFIVGRLAPIDPPHNVELTNFGVLRCHPTSRRPKRASTVWSSPSMVQLRMECGTRSWSRRASRHQRTRSTRVSADTSGGRIANTFGDVSNDWERAPLPYSGARSICVRPGAVRGAVRARRHFAQLPAGTSPPSSHTFTSSCAHLCRWEGASAIEWR